MDRVLETNKRALEGKTTTLEDSQRGLKEKDLTLEARNNVQKMELR